VVPAMSAVLAERVVLEGAGEPLPA